MIFSHPGNWWSTNMLLGEMSSYYPKHFWVLSRLQFTSIGCKEAFSRDPFKMFAVISGALTIPFCVYEQKSTRDEIAKAVGGDKCCTYWNSYLKIALDERSEDHQYLIEILWQWDCYCELCLTLQLASMVKTMLCFFPNPLGLLSNVIKIRLQLARQSLFWWWYLEPSRSIKL